MSLRHISRPQERPDVRMHETTPVPSHSQLFSTHPSQPPPPPSHHAPPPHLNGNAPIPPAPLANGSSHGNPIVSPTAVTNSVPNGVGSSSSITHKLAVANEQTWLLIGRVAEQMADLDHALSAYENALRHNPVSLAGLTQVAGIARIKENYPKAIDYFQRVLQLQEDNGEVWSALGHCYLMQDDLQKAYSAYQQALYLLPNPKEDPKLWYGIGILYDRYGSLDHAEEAFSSVLRMDKDLDFDKANEILFRLGIIYKQQGKYEESLACFDRILRNPPSPLAHADIWFQIGHVYEQQKDHVRAKDAYERVVADNPGHAKVLQQLGWLYHQDGSSFQNQELAIQYLTKSLEADSSDAQSWYLLGRAYMAGQKYNKAYEAYQQAVYRDGRNPTFWCSIGVLYFQINQFRDALDAYSRAIRINPYISEVWFDLGSLYESCNNQISDAIDAYARASELDPGNHVISQRLQLLKNAQATGGALPAAPGPQDVHPTAYASAVIPPPGLTGPPLLLQPTSQRPPPFRTDSRGPPNEISLPPPSQVGNGPSSPPFRGGPPPPVVLDESRHVSSHTPLAPMDVDRPPPHSRDYPPPPARDPPPPNRGPAGHNVLLQHPVPQHQIAAEELRNGAHSAHHPDSYFSNRSRVPPSRSPTPPPPARRSPFQPYPPPGRQIGPGQPSIIPTHRSPRTYHNEPPPRPLEQENGWDRRQPPPPEPREWERRHQSRPSGDYPPSSQTTPHFYPPRSPGPRGHSPEPSPRSSHAMHHPPRPYWDAKPSPSTSHAPTPYHQSPPPPPDHHREPPPPSRRYDPRFDARDQYDREAPLPEPRDARYAGASESLRHPPPPPSSAPTQVSSGSESPRNGSVAPEGDKKRRRSGKDLQPPAPPMNMSDPESAKKDARRRRAKRKAEDSRSETPKPPSERGGYKVMPGYKGAGSPEPLSSGSSRSVQPSPISNHARPSRDLDEDYDEGVAETLIGLAQYRPEPSRPVEGGPSHSPTVSAGSRHSDPSPRPIPHHRDSISSTRSHASPPIPAANLKRPLSPGSDSISESKRSRVVSAPRRVSSPSVGRRTPTQSTRPSPIPFRTQLTSHSPEARQVLDSYAPASPSIPALPPHPRPIGAGHSSSHASQQMALPPIATLSPTSSAASPAAQSERDRDDRMQVDRSLSPPSRGKMGESRSPKNSPGAKAEPTP